MSLKAHNWAWSVPDLSPTQKLVLLRLADHADEDDCAWPSIASVARATGLSDRAVRDAIRGLEAAKVIGTKHRAGKNGAPTSSRYRLNVAEVTAGTEPAAVPASPAGSAPHSPGVRNLLPEGTEPAAVPYIESPIESPNLEPPRLPGWQPKAGEPALVQALAELFRRAPELKPKRKFAAKYAGMPGTGLPAALESKLAHGWAEMAMADPPATWSEFLLISDYFLSGQLQWCQMPFEYIAGNLPSVIEAAIRWEKAGRPAPGRAEVTPPAPAVSDYPAHRPMEQTEAQRRLRELRKAQANAAAKSTP
jgi:hypothetical protein